MWITRAEAGSIAPGLTSARLDYIRREAPYSSRITAPPARVLSDGEVIYDELALRRWLESTVSFEWVHGHFGAYRAQPTSDRRYIFQDADLETLRHGRTSTRDNCTSLCRRCHCGEPATFGFGPSGLDS